MNKKKVSLSYLFFTFLKIGTISWGGFMALISVVQKQLVEKDKVLEDEIILDNISLASILPGPVAFNVVTGIGYFLRGFKGAVVSMVGIILPSFIFITLLAWFYSSFNQIPALNNFFLGVLPAVAAVIITVAINMIKKHIKDLKQVVILALAAVVLIFLKSFFTTLLIIVIGAVAGYFLYRGKNETVVLTDTGKRTRADKKSWNIWIYIIIGVTLFFALLWFLPEFFKGTFFNEIKTLRDITFTFAGMSLTLFGGGYVVIPAIQQVVVDGLQWMTIQEFTDAIAMGQITPGPIFISAAFIGYKVFGFWGAVAATFAIFTPPGLLMIFCSQFINQIKNSQLVTTIYKGIRPAVIGMILAAAYTIGRGIDLSWESVLIFAGVLILSVKFKVNVVYLIPVAGVAGVLLFL